MSRALKPRPELAIAPLAISSDTCFPALGITKRVFHERVVPRCKRVARPRPRLAVVPVDEVLRVLAEMANEQGGDEEPVALGELRSSADVFRRLGVRAGGAR